LPVLYRRWHICLQQQRTRNNCCQWFQRNEIIFHFFIISRATQNFITIKTSWKTND
jgi:hypothetical protein